MFAPGDHVMRERGNRDADDDDDLVLTPSANDSGASVTGKGRA
jgi:hypothetical protein